MSFPLVLFVDGKSVDLPRDVRIRLQMNSPLFGDDFAGDLSFPFDLKITPNNAQILGYAHHVNASVDRRKEYPATLAAGPIVLTGTLQLRKFTDRGYQVNLIIPPANIPRKTWETSLRKLDFGKVEFETEEKPTFMFVTSTEGLGLGGLSSFKVYNRSSLIYQKNYAASDFAGETLDGILDFIFAHFNEQGQKTNYGNTGMEAFLADDQIAISANPSDELSKIRFEFLPASGRNPVELSLTHLKYRTWANAQMDDLGNNVLLTDERFAFPMVKNGGWYDPSANPGFVGYVNFFAVGRYLHNDYSLRTLYSLVPFLKVKWVMAKLASVLGYHFEDDFFTGELADLVLYNNCSLDENVPGLKVPFNQYKSTITFADHLPDLTPKEFINQLGKTFGFRPVFNIPQRIVKLVKLNDLPKATAGQDFTAKIWISYDGEVPETQNCKLDFSLDSSDEYAKMDLTQLNTIDPILKAQNMLFQGYPQYPDTRKTTPIQSPFAPILQYKTTIPARPRYAEKNYISPPMMKQKCISPLFSQKDEKPASPRLAFFRSRMDITENLVNDENPRGGVLGYFGVPSLSFETENYSLAWVAENGLVNKFWKNWLTVLDTTYPLKRNVKLSELAVMDLISYPDRPIHMDGQNYLPAHVDVEFGINGIIGSVQVTWHRA